MSFFKKVFNWIEENTKKELIKLTKTKSIKNKTKNHHALLDKIQLQKNTSELSIAEILMLIDKNNSSVQNIYFQGFWEYIYNIDAEQTFRNLLKKGYFKVDASLEDTLNKMTVPELKEILKKENLKVTGRKSELIERILNKASFETKNAIPLIEVYSLSEKGKNILDQNKHIVYLDKMKLRDVSIYQYHDFMKRNKELEPFEGLIKYLEEVSHKHITNNDWGLYSNILYQISIVYSKEGFTEEALKYIILVCYLDINCTMNNCDLETIKSLYKYNKEDYFKPYESNADTIPPAILRDLSKHKTELNLTDLELENVINQVTSLIDLPFQNFPKDVAAKVILAELSNDIEALKKYYSNIEEYVVNNYF